ncbi:hypothetical protein L228DRAFT_267836 [Xylona heveae TC161]|uniref:DUF7918 domain-containing protein n=1 Tax=Xylona heveae (strain CBS 132557 / TC161) TaxID=1328760 RepID=A0A165HS47_XYLHT|nr:hypothetical protein L228DRAFT_267836 [Xylona heveae TC161]KZF23879.1 hypothetical protein L228DRAFT_267836 [Xylona heveae TC161]
MPTLKQLTCQIEWARSGGPLQEFATSYADGFVQTYVAVPQGSVPFTIRLKSNGYIAPGLAMFVYMDGIYQCNRNRQGLKAPEVANKASEYEVDFLVRQKEEKLRDGNWLGREWRFEKLNVVAGDSQEAKDTESGKFDQLGTIEVVVLRCTRPKHEFVPPLRKTPNLQRMTERQPGQDGEGGMLKGLFDGIVEEWEIYSIHTSESSNIDSGGGWNSTQIDGSSNSQQKKYDERQHDRARYTRGGIRDNPDMSSDHEEQILESSIRRYNRDWRRNGVSITPDETVEEEENPGPQVSPDSAPARRLHERFGEFSADGQSSQDQPSVVIHITPPPPAPDPPPAVDPRLWEQRRHYRGNPEGGSWNFDESSSSSYSRGQRYSAVPPQQYRQSSNTQHYAHHGPSGSTFPRVPGEWPEPESMSDIDDGHLPRRTKQPPSKPPGSIVFQEPLEHRGRGSPSGRHRSQSPKKSSRPRNASRNTRRESMPTVEEDWGGESNIDSRAGYDLSSEPEENLNDGEWDKRVGHPRQYVPVMAPQPWSLVPSGWTPYIPQSWPYIPSGTQWPGPEPASPDHSAPANETLDADDRPQRPRGREDNGSQRTKSPAHRSNWDTPDTNNWATSNQNEDNNDWNNDNWDNNDWGADTSQPQQEGDADVAAKVEAAWASDRHPSRSGSPTASAHSSASTAKPTFQVPHILPYTQPYWSKWNRADNLEEESPLYNVPEDIAKKKAASHQVQTGRPAPYTHRTCRPVYVDTYDKPYAVFVFKYRSRETIERLFGITIPVSADDERRRLASLSKEQIIEELLKSRTAPSHKETKSHDGEDNVTHNGHGSQKLSDKAGQKAKDTQKDKYSASEMGNDKQGSSNTTWRSGKDTKTAGWIKLSEDSKEWNDEEHSAVDDEQW